MSWLHSGAKGPHLGNDKPIRFKTKKKKGKKNSKATSVGKFEREETKLEDGVDNNAAEEQEVEEAL